MYSDKEGKRAVELARAAIEKHLGGGSELPSHLPEVFREKSGVFVTLNRYPSRDLRGCIGFPEPIMPLAGAIEDAAVSAATRDPRFPPVSLGEMDRIVVDVTMLTPPERIDHKGPDDLVSKIVIGRDGLIARKGFYSGLLLPQVPVEWGWSVEEFLSHTCMKAGLAPDSWREGNVSFQRFSGYVYGEREPRGQVERMELG